MSKDFESQPLNENDVYSFIYSWFANVDRFAKSKVYKKYLCPQNLEMTVNKNKISNFHEYKAWYKNYCSNIKWQFHEIKNIKIAGNVNMGFNISFDAIWKVEKKDNSPQSEKDMHHDWIVIVYRNELRIRKLTLFPNN